MSVGDGALDAEELHPAAKRADDHEEHEHHDDDRKRREEVLAGRQVLVDDEPDARPERDDRHEDAGHARHPGVLRMIEANDHGRADQQRHGSKQLVADAEERPDRADVARVDQIAPRAGEDHGRDDDARPPFLVVELRNDLAHHFLQEEAPDAGAGVNSRQNEDGFEHDGEVIPVGHQMFHERNLREDVRHADGERHRTARTAHQAFLHFRFELWEFLHGHAERRKLFSRRIDREVVGRHEHAGGYERHHGNEAFHQHRAVAHEENVAFVADHLRRRAGADEGMEARKRAAGDRNEDERNHGAAHDRTAARNEVRKGGHLEIRHHEGNADRKRGDRADLEERREIVARQEQEPHREHRREEAVDRNKEAHRRTIDVEPAEVFRMSGNPRARKDAEEKKNDADQRCALHVALAPDLHVKAHDDRDRNRRRDRIGRPERVVHRVHDGDRKAG